MSETKMGENDKRAAHYLEKLCNMGAEQLEEIEQIREIVQNIHLTNMAIFGLFVKYMKSKGIGCKDLVDILKEYTIEKPESEK